MSDLPGFLAALGDVPVARDAPTLLRKSRDFYWYSPVLKPLLDPMRADLVVAPRDEANPHVVTLEDGSRHKRVPGDQFGFNRRSTRWACSIPERCEASVRRDDQ